MCRRMDKDRELPAGRRAGAAPGLLLPFGCPPNFGYAHCACGRPVIPATQRDEHGAVFQSDLQQGRPPTPTVFSCCVGSTRSDEQVVNSSKYSNSFLNDSDR